MKILFYSIIILSFLLIGCNKSENEIVNTSCNIVNNESTQNSCDFVDYEYYNGAQDTLGYMSNDYLLIGIDTTFSDSQIQTFISGLNQFDQSYVYTIHKHIGYKFKEIPLKFNNSKSCVEVTQIMSELEQHEIVSYVHYTMQTDDCNNGVWQPIGNLCINTYASSFYVQVLDENDLSDLNQIILQTNTELVRQIAFTTDWYELRATKSSNGDALSMANYFFETGLFLHSGADITKYPVE